MASRFFGPVPATPGESGAVESMELVPERDARQGSQRGAHGIHVHEGAGSRQRSISHKEPLERISGAAERVQCAQGMPTGQRNVGQHEAESRNAG